jgi:hypothetical protein
MLRLRVALLTWPRRADAGDGTSEGDARRARRADADYATSEGEAKKEGTCAVQQHMLRAHVALFTRSRRADAGYSNSESYRSLCEGGRSLRIRKQGDIYR